ncbi:MAG: transglycosylase SLT domain-containing protein [Nitrospirae bacterium]|nr:transglycosylase SLT domain-containing protein [Nitrospirota bacterium]
MKKFLDKKSILGYKISCMIKIRIFAVSLFFLLCISPLYASQPLQETPIEDNAFILEAATIEAKAESEILPDTARPEETATQTKPEVKVESEQKATVSAPEITPYKSNPVAVKAVENSVFLFTDRIKGNFSLWLSRSGKYLELMKDILKNKDVPENVVFLSLIESGFNPYAYSVARASGPWQFISSTAKQYGLVIDWWRDERRDPVKSTTAAADYLKNLYDMFGSWNLAMAAYNAGEGKIFKALKRSKADDYWDLLETKHIRKETKNYVPNFIAASMIAVNPEEFGFKDIQYHPPLDYDEIILTGPIDLEVAARCAETTVEIVRELNPELRRWCTPPDMPAYMLRIPAGTKELFMENLESIPEDERFTVETYKAKKGDTLKKIAKKNGITVDAILALNSIEKIKSMKIGTVLAMPPKEKFTLDNDDRYQTKKASYKTSSKKYRKSSYTSKKTPKSSVTKTRPSTNKNKKVILTAQARKKEILND